MPRKGKKNEGCPCLHGFEKHDLAFHGPKGSGLYCEECDKVCVSDANGWHQR